MAAVSYRTILVLRCYDMSRAFSFTATRRYHHNRKETWCRRWWHISHRSLSTATRNFSPSLCPILRKDGEKSSKESTESTRKASSKEPKSTKENNVTMVDEETFDVTVTYHRGLPRITVPLPSRKQSCMFTLKPVTHTVGDFINMLKVEDRGIDTATITTLDGTRVGSSTTIESLMEDDFKLMVNDNEYIARPPQHQILALENLQNLSDIKTLVGQLYENLQVREHHAEMERQLMGELERVRIELEPLEQHLQELEVTASKRAHLFTWGCLVMMSMQFGALARLTWWEYSWDIMEPITYFVTYGTTMGWFIYFLLTKQEYMLPDVLHRRHLLVLHRRARKAGLDVDLYNRLKDEAYELENALKVLRGPLYEYKSKLQQKKRERESSSSSRSPSSSPSPSPEPRSPKKSSSIKNSLISDWESKFQRK